MKLIRLICILIVLFCDGVYQAITLPYSIWIVYKNRRWRKTAKVGDRCFFINMLQTKTWGTITDVYPNRNYVTLQTDGSIGPHKLKDLRIV